MSNDDNRYVVSHRHRRAFGWLTAAVAVILLVAGVFYTTGRWGEDNTRTGGGATTAQVPPGAGPAQPGVPTEGARR